jgi:proteasome accessory factor A
VASKSGVFERLAGLETEYAVSVRPLPGSSSSAFTPPTKLEIYERVLTSLSRRLPAVRAYHLKEGAFLATGGAIWFEANRLTSGGLLEGATPECRTPGDVVAYQRAQDRLLEAAVEEAGVDCEIRLIKNDRDAQNNIYGAQENYEAEFARGVWLALWRVGLVALLPLMLLTWLGVAGLFVISFAYELLATGVVIPLGDLLLPRGLMGRMLLGVDRIERRAFGAPWPAWLETVMLFFEKAVTGPLALALYGLLLVTGFRNVRRRLLPFLISRPIIAGAGMLDGDGRFLIADKGPAINGILGYGGFFHGRPIVLLGEFYKRLAQDALFAPQDFLDLFQPRQRLQLGIGDSNMCATAEWLRVGTTMLVLDCLEAGELPEPPKLRRPISALRAICADSELGLRIDTTSGRCTALELQRFYCNACRRFLARREQVPAEAQQLVEAWEDTLDALELNPRALVGRLDWVTKRFLLETASADASWESLKKIDLKYHELSAEGYFRLLAAEFEERTPVTEEAVERAMRMPPADSPASMRGRLIREFVGGDEPLAVNWRMVRIGHGASARLYRLTEFRSDSSDVDSRRRERSPEWLDDVDGSSE